MRTELNKIEEIENYLNGNLTKTEVAAFEKNMLNDIDLKEQVAAQKLVQQAILRKSIRADVMKFGAGATIINGWSSKWYIALGGGLAVLAIIIGSYLLLNYPKSDLIVAEYGQRKQLSLQDKESVNNYVAQESTLNYTDKSPSNNARLNETNPVKDSENSKESKDSTRNPKVDKTSNRKESFIGGLKTWATPVVQHFEVSPEQGTTFEGKDGSLIIVPKDAFIDEKGNIITSTVTVEVVEALNMAEMVGYNLVTMNNDQPLSSGGMIYIQPKSNGKDVKINPERPLYIEIPTDNYNPDMMAWESETNEAGDINWKNPKPLKKYLTKIDFANLDFLPEGFDQAVASGMPYKNHTETTDELIDSLYYNCGIISTNEIAPAEIQMKNSDMRETSPFYGVNTIKGRVVDSSGQPIEGVSVTISKMGKVQKKIKLTDKKGDYAFRFVTPGVGMILFDKENIQNRDSIEYNPTSTSINPIVGFTQEITTTLYKPGEKIKNKKAPEVTSIPSTIETAPEGICYINPQSIKAIKSSKFANTFLATKEFEQRLRILHTMPNAQELFEIYIYNLSQDLWVTDQKVSDRLTGNDKTRFRNFAKEKLTNVENDCIYQKQLSEFYNSKKAEYNKALKEFQAQYSSTVIAELEKEQLQLSALISNYNNLLSESKSKTFKAGIKSSFNNNLISSQDIAQTNPATNPVFTNSVINSSNSYATVWYTPGWMNIDSYIKTLSINPKTTEINCEDKTPNNENTKIYQCINTLKTVIPLYIANNIARAKFPGKLSKGSKQMKNTYCIGIKKDGMTTKLAYQKYNPYKVDAIKLEWETIDNNQLIRKLKDLPGFNSNIIKDLKTQEKVIKRQLKVNRQRKALTNEINTKRTEVDNLRRDIEIENTFIKSLQRVINSCKTDEENLNVNIVTTPINSDEIDNTVLYTDVEKQPFYPMCLSSEYDIKQAASCSYQKIQSFIKDGLIIPQSIIDQEISGKVLVSYTVSTLGFIEDVIIYKSLHPDIDQEAIRVVSLIPRMKPGVQNGEAVKVRYTLPISVNIK